MSESQGSQGTTFEEARRCPACETYGVQVRTIPKSPAETNRGRPAVLHMFTCPNGERDKHGILPQSCRLYDQGWVVMVYDDGLIPMDMSPQRRDSDRAFPKGLIRPNSAEEERILRSLNNQLTQETQQGGGEIRRGR